jgi:hypothetical protein
MALFLCFLLAQLFYLVNGEVLDWLLGPEHFAGVG